MRPDAECMQLSYNSLYILFPAVSVVKVKPTPNLIACTCSGGRARNKTVQTDK